MLGAGIEEPARRDVVNADKVESGLAHHGEIRARFFRSAEMVALLVGREWPVGDAFDEKLFFALEEKFGLNADRCAELHAIQLVKAGPDVERIAGLTLRSRRGRVRFDVNIAIALAQFIMLALGVMASIILSSSGDIPNAGSWSAAVERFAASRGLWLLVIPAAWLLAAEWCARARPKFLGTVQSAGIGIVVAILAAIVLVLSAT